MLLTSLGYSQQTTASTDPAPACPAEFNDSLETNGVLQVNIKDPDNHVRPPRVTHSVEAKFSDEARRHAKKKFFSRFKGVSIVSLVVDKNGMPQNVCVKQFVGLKLDEEAVNAVRQYRFSPATLNDMPVAVRISVAVEFKLF